MDLSGFGEPLMVATKEKPRTESRLRRIPGDVLERVLAAHANWLKTGGRRGRQADLHRTGLRGAGLTRTSLKSAILDGAALAGADLSTAARLKRDQLDQACGNWATKLPLEFLTYRIRHCEGEEDSDEASGNAP